MEAHNRLDLRSIREVNRVEVIHTHSECVLSALHQFEQSTTRIQHGDDHFYVVGTSRGYHFLWCVTCIDHHHLIGWHVVQHEIGVE